MTVAELIAKLNGMPQQSDVFVMDDSGSECEVDVYRDGDGVYIEAGAEIDEDEEEIEIDDDEDDE